MMQGGAWYGPTAPLHQITLADDRGTKVATSFSGGGSDEEWRGHLHSHGPLAKDTAWIELDGERIDLEDVPASGRGHRRAARRPALRTAAFV